MTEFKVNDIVKRIDNTPKGEFVVLDVKPPVAGVAGLEERQFIQIQCPKGIGFWPANEFELVEE